MRSPIAKRRVINWYFLGPVIGYIVTAIALVAAVVHFAHHRGRLALPPASAMQRTPNDALAHEIAHCQAMGAEAANDTDCIAAWAENRRRFFSGDSTAAHLAAAPTAPAKSGKASQP